jgi:hypothetical protein
LIELFKKKSSAEMKIDKRWLVRIAKHQYDKLYSHRVIWSFDKRDEYIDFKFSLEWFHNFKKRADISFRAIIKKTQTMSENLRFTIQKWLQYNRRNFQSLSDQIS